MDQLSTNHPIALSILLNEDIYVLKEDTQAPIAVAESPKNLQPETTVEPMTSSAVMAETPKKAVTQGFDYLGENNKFWLIIVKEDKNTFISESDKQFLLKILAAKKLQLDDIAIVNLHHYPQMEFVALKDYFAMSRVLTFGFNPLLLNIKGISSNQAGVYQNVKILGTWTLAQLQADVNKKTIYWKELKNF